MRRIPKATCLNPLAAGGAAGAAGAFTAPPPPGAAITQICQIRALSETATVTVTVTVTLFLCEDEDEDQEEQSPQQSCIKILDTSSITNPDSDHHHHGHKTTNNYISETIRNYVSISSHHSNNPTAKEHRSHHVPAITQPLLAASTNAVLMDGDQTS